MYYWVSAHLTDGTIIADSVYAENQEQAADEFVKKSKVPIDEIADVKVVIEP